MNVLKKSKVARSRRTWCNSMERMSIINRPPARVQSPLGAHAVYPLWNPQPPFFGLGRYVARKHSKLQSHGKTSMRGGARVSIFDTRTVCQQRQATSARLVVARGPPMLDKSSRAADEDFPSCRLQMKGERLRRVNSWIPTPAGTPMNKLQHGLVGTTQSRPFKLCVNPFDSWSRVHLASGILWRVIKICALARLWHTWKRRALVRRDRPCTRLIYRTSLV